MIYEPEFESMPRDQLQALQSRRLRDLMSYVYDRVPFYRRKLDEAGIRPESVSCVRDLPRLPLTRKSDLRDNYPFGLFAVPMNQITRIHASSGTTGKPTVVGYTCADIDLFARVNARSLAMAGAEPGMILHNAYGYGLFTGGLGLHYGGERLGMAVVPVSGGMTERQITLITDFRPEVVASTPSYALTLGQELQRRGVRPGEISLRFALLGAEPWTPAMRAEVDACLGVRSCNLYGLSEIVGPGVACECIEARDGSHVCEDHFLPEIVDPATGEPLPEGNEGVLVITTLTKQALPLVRYWTGDITRLSYEPCRCGRTLARMGLVKGRTDDMLIIRGVNVYPSEVGMALGRLPELSPHYRVVVTRERTLDEMEIQVEVTDEFLRIVGTETLSEEFVERNQLAQSLRGRAGHALREALGVGARVTLATPGSLPRSEGGKLLRVQDLRDLARGSGVPAIQGG